MFCYNVCFSFPIHVLLLQGVSACGTNPRAMKHVSVSQILWLFLHTYTSTQIMSLSDDFHSACFVCLNSGWPIATALVVFLLPSPRMPPSLSSDCLNCAPLPEGFHGIDRNHLPPLPPPVSPKLRSKLVRPVAP